MNISANQSAPGGPRHIAAPTYHEWYERTYPRLSHLGLWLRGGELNTLPADEYFRRPLRVLFTRLSTYYDTGYSFTHQLLYQVAADTEGVYPDLAYLPPRRDLPVFQRDGVPWLLGSQSKQGPRGFDLIGLSNSIVQELINVPSFLERSGLPLSKRERLSHPELPLIILGGANALYTSALWHDDPMVDGIFVGESEAAIRRMLVLARDAKLAGASKAEVLERFEELPGFLQPDRPRQTRKAFIPNLNRSEALERGPVYYLADQLGSSHLQISEGCPCFCSFCAESWDRKPYRERNAAVLETVALRAKAGMGLDQIDLYSFNFNMHSGFYDILWDLAPLFGNVGLKSQRFDLLAHDPRMLDFQHALEKSNLTCGLEGISPRLRRYLHKNLEDVDLHASLEAIFKSGARGLKVFLIATGLEEAQDLQAFTDLLEHMLEIRRKARASTRVVFSMTPLVRFPWTPLEFEDAPPRSRYEPIIGATADRVRSAGFEFRESADLPEYWVSQVLVRADDARIGQALLAAIAKTGEVYHREISPAFADAMLEELQARGLDERAVLAGYDFERGEQKPWTRVATGVDRSFLWQEVQRARGYKEIDYCLGRSWTRAKCFHCGGCPTKEHVRDIVLAKQTRDYTLAEFETRLRRARDAERQCSLLVAVGPRGRGVPRKLVGVAVARALMLTEERLQRGYRGFVSSQASATDDTPCWREGLDRLTLIWDEPSIRLIRDLLANPETMARVAAQLDGWATLIDICESDWSPSVITMESPFPFAADAYFEAARLKVSRLRSPTGAGYEFELSRDAKRRGVLRSLHAEPGADGGARVALEPGPKFDLMAFVTLAFRLPKPEDWVRIRCRAHDARAAVEV
ncbi:MAG: hypothetical protein AB7O52_17910 [Planctomycetota bacterium]